MDAVFEWTNGLRTQAFGAFLVLVVVSWGLEWKARSASWKRVGTAFGRIAALVYGLFISISYVAYTAHYRPETTTQTIVVVASIWALLFFLLISWKRNGVVKRWVTRMMKENEKT